MYKRVKGMWFNRPEDDSFIDFCRKMLNELNIPITYDNREHFKFEVGDSVWRYLGGVLPVYCINDIMCYKNDHILPHEVHVSYDSLYDSYSYAINDIDVTKELLNKRYGYYGVRRNSGRYPWKSVPNVEIKKVIFSMPATIVLWEDGTKTIVKCQDEDFDKEKGLAMAICKKVLGTNDSKSNFNDIFKEWCGE